MTTTATISMCNRCAEREAKTRQMCRRCYEIERRSCKFGPNPLMDPKPLVEHAARIAKARDLEPNSHVLGDILGVAPDTVRRWRLGNRRIRLSDADKAAIRTGYHPWHVWGDEWWTA